MPLFSPSLRSLQFMFGALLGGLLCLPMPASGQVPAQPINQPCTACEATSVHAADLDGDGNTDVLSTSQFDDKVAWYKNNGGSYGAQQVISTASDKPQTVTAADLDGDGDLDVISGSKGDDELVWYENQIGESGADSDGFGPAQVITSSAGTINDVAAGKIDGDNKADIVVGTEGSGVVWFESQIGESGDDFSSANTIASSSMAISPVSVVLVDLGGDSSLDVLFGDESGRKIAWHENTGGSFGSENLVSEQTEYVTDVSAADLDKDGDLDIASVSSTDGTVAWYENTGSSFGGQTVINSSGSPKAVSTADADGDGDAEIFAAIIGFSGPDRFVWFERSDSDGFSSSQTVTTSMLDPTDVTTAELTGDSRPELISVSGLDDKVAWYENTGGSYSSSHAVNAWPDAAFPRSVEAAPINDDATPDVLVASQQDGKVSWYTNTDGQGTFSGQHVIASLNRQPQKAVAAPLNDDNKPDAIVAANGASDGSTTGLVAWYENQTNESGSDADGFGSINIVAEGEGFDHLSVADLNGDSKQDIVAIYGGYGSQKVVWYENQIGEAGSDADGFSTENVIASGLTSTESLHVADLNGGGHDVLFGYGFPYSDPQKLVWHENTDGNGSFSSEKIIESYSGYSVLSLATAEVDSDSDLDLVAGLFDVGSGDTVVWYENEIGQGGDSDGFSSQTTVTTNIQRPRDVHLADVNDDSKPDLLSASRDGDTIAWYKNTGGGFSSQTVVSSKAFGVTSVTTATVDQDTDLDLLAASEGSEEIAWYENTGTVLPVELASIDATVKKGQVTLSWTTASETNNAGFRIQRKAVMSPEAVKTSRQDGSTSPPDGGSRSWTTVGSVEGSGTTAQAQSYRFTDAELPYEANALTYRLKQVDTDGTTHYSKTITVERGVSEVQLLGTYPNPARQQATVRYALPERQDVTVRLYDVLGRQVQTVVSDSKEGRHEQTLDVSGLSSGVYFLRLQANGETRTQKITVTR